MRKPPPPVPTKRILPADLGKARNLTSARLALPKDWDDWFPGTIQLLVDVPGPDITVQHILDFAAARLKQVEDPHRLLEAAQCCALIWYLGNPSPDTIVTSIYGR
jgi:hypothetical protein